MASSRPAWQTDELEDEWIDAEPSTVNEDDDDENDYLNGTRSISLTAPLVTIIHTTTHDSNDLTSSSIASSSSSPSTSTRPAGGTFLVHESVANGPLLPKTPGRNKKTNIKDFFSPLPLERMFEPPSPPPASPPSHPPPQYKSSPEPISSSAPIPSITTSQSSSNTHSDEILATDLPGMSSFDGRKPSLGCQFTFAAPKEGWLNPNAGKLYPQAESTPGHLNAPGGAPPSSDPPLRLFQFQYDTFTRDHLSAMVDSIAVNTGPGSGTTNSPTTPSYGLSKVSEIPSSTDVSHLRSAKRLKLSPSTDFEHVKDSEKPISIARPRIYGKEYVGASQSLMQAIKDARDYSTISTVVSEKRDDRDEVEGRNTSRREGGNRSVIIHDITQSPASSIPTPKAPPVRWSSSRFREQGAALLAQIKDDMRGQKRIFSGESEYSVINQSEASSHFGAGSEVRTSVGTRQSERAQRSARLNQSPSPAVTSPGKNKSRSDSKQSTLRRLGAAHPTDAELSQRMSTLSVQNRHVSSTSAPTQPRRSATNTAPVVPEQALSTSTAPPSHPSSSIRHSTTDDLNRYVSSSTASGTTTLTSGSVPSFVKHPGPAQIRTIAPSDVPGIPERIGNLMFDKVLMKWVKNSATVTGASDYLPPEEVSEDPFGDIESLRDDSRGRSMLGDGAEHEDEEEEDGPEDQSFGIGHTELSRVEEQSEVEDEEELVLTSFETDDASARIVDVMTGIEDDDARTTDSEAGQDELIADEHSELVEATVEVIDSENESDLTTTPPRDVSVKPSSSSVVPIVNTIPDTPNRPQSLQPSSSSIRSVLKTPGATPTSALKDSSVKYKTPLRHPKHRRSVSFSDGKREGPIRGLGRNGEDDSELDYSEEAADANHTVPSARSKRIADMMAALEDSDSDSRSDQSPSKASSSGASRPEELQPLAKRQPSSAPINSNASTSRSPKRVFSRSDAFRSPNKTGNQTFLTECSFGVAHDRLVQVITDVEPFEPHWEQLSAIDLSGKNIESAARLKEFLPKLDSLKMFVIPPLFRLNGIRSLTQLILLIGTITFSRGLAVSLARSGHYLSRQIGRED
ncbi:Protein nud1 [Marasmius tenuissimus]|uniref:Protein nud1 n=1 Tax=Marasmius tenuissimus TaxID=585030 RepID=A0ABR2ZYU2_9AGAR